MAEGNRKEPRYLSINDRIVFDRTGTIYRDGKSLYSGENALIAVLGILVDRAGDIVSPEEIVALSHTGTRESVPNLISALRKLIGDTRKAADGKSAGYTIIATSQGKGYNLNPAYIRPVRDAVSSQPEQGSTSDWLKAVLGDYKDIAFFDMLFLTDFDWLYHDAKRAVLKTLAEKRIPVRILMADPEAADPVVGHIRGPYRMTLDSREVLDLWKKQLARYEGAPISLRTVNLPILHRLYIIRKTDGSVLINRHPHIYGSAELPQYTEIFTENDAVKTDLYVREFEYLWDLSEEI